jgi:nucleoside-diphosphate-sugar epimerase
VLARDVASAMVLAKDAPGIEGKTFNLSSDIRPSAREIVNFIAERSRRNFQFVPRRMWAMGAANFGLNAAKKLLGKPIYESFRDLKSCSMTADLDCSTAKQLLGWKPESDRAVFFREAIECHIQPLQPGDLRLEPHATNI